VRSATVHTLRLANLCSTNETNTTFVCHHVECAAEMAVRTILYKVFIGNKQPRQHAVQYWSAVRRNLGGDIGLKDMIIQVRRRRCLTFRT
jgi:hypothetical protein